MATTIESESIPLRVDPYGAIRVGDSRVTLDLIVSAFYNGESAEGIAEMYDTLDLGDIYLSIGYFLHHKEQVLEYLRERERDAQEIRAKIEARQGSQQGLRERLLARLEAKNAKAAGG